MSIDENKRTVQRVFDALNRGDIAALGELAVGAALAVAGRRAWGRRRGRG